MKQFLACLLLLVGTLLSACDSTEGPFCPVSSKGPCGLGQAFFVPSLSIVEDNGNGIRIFEEMAPECLNFVPSFINKQEKNFFEDAETFYNKLGSQSGLSGEVSEGFTLGASLVAASNYIDYKDMNVKGASMDVFAITGFWDVVPECFAKLPLTAEFEKAFANLPDVIRNPHLSSSWYLYDALLRNYGSHVINRISYGSKLTKYIFTKSSEEATSRDLLIKTCASISQVDLGACQGFTDDDYNKVKSLSASEQLVVRGGKTETRAKLMSNLTQDLLEQFMEEADQTNQPISQKFHSIWDILKKRYMGTSQFVKAVNLEAYYQGYLAAGCSFKKEDAQALRLFVLAEYDPNVPSYECQLAPRGCRGDNDCHHNILDGPCYCYGPGCVDGRPKPDAHHSVQTERYIKRENDYGSAWGGVNNSCRLKMGVMCTCDKSWGGGWQTVWPNSQYKDNAKMMREAQRKLQKFNRD